MDLQEAKQYEKTAGHVSVVVPNVLSYVEGEALKQQYKPGREIIVISNGRVSFFGVNLLTTHQLVSFQHGGAAYLGVLWGMTFGDFFAKTVKSKDLMVGLVRRTLGL